MGRHDRLLHTLYKLFIEHYIQVLFIFPLSAAGWLAGLAGVFGVAAVRLIILAAITVYGLLLLLYLGGMLVAFKRKIKKLEQNLLSIDRSLQRVEKSVMNWEFLPLASSEPTRCTTCIILGKKR